MKRVFRQTAVFVMVLFSAFFAQAESFRVRKLIPVQLSGDSTEEHSVAVGIYDSVAVLMPEDMTYVEGLELKIQIPEAVADWRDSVAISVYDNIYPAPSEAETDYAGTKLMITTLPARLNWIVQIPLKAKNSIKDSNYISKFDILPNTDNGNVFIRFQPAMKGVPDSTYEAVLNISVKPVLINKGTAKISVKSPDNKPASFDVLVDDQPVKLTNGKILLEKGNHNINIQSEEYRSEVRSVYIEQAKTTDVQFSLKSLAPTLTVNAPENVQVFLDGTKFFQIGKEVAVEEGQHTVSFSIGGYEVVRQVDVHKGKSYTANLTVDLEISEE